jgi:predicted ATP-binding protein involved in virulence
VRIKDISIQGLFGSYNHEIPLFQHEPITIIHGPNGVGKTSILKLVTGALRPSFTLLRSVPFLRLVIQFDNGGRLEVAPGSSQEPEQEPRSRGEVRRRRVAFTFRFMHHGHVEEFAYRGPRPRTARIEQWLPLHRFGEDEWLDPRTNQLLSYEEVVQLYGPELPEEFRGEEIPVWLAQIQKATPVHFIQTQRLLRVKFSDPRRPGASQESTVKECSHELSQHISELLAKSATLSQNLERSFPTRVIAGTGTKTGPVSEEEIRKALNDLDQKRSRLVEAGLLEPSQEPTLPTTRFDETTQRVLGVYIRDTEQKLEVFDDMLRRIELIRNIIDARFLQKTVAINRAEGFSVRTRDGRPLDLSGLSSGEQHELVLLYELLFRAKSGTMILIDEPELSLHIAWQQKFLRDLVQIATLAKLTALVATHSPQIIHDRWDLTVELLGPQ